jgi:hypothetical protein
MVTTGFRCSDGTTAPGPYLLPPSFNNDGSYSPLVMYIPSVAGPNVGGSGACVPASDPGNPDFTLAWVTIASESWAQVSVPPTNVYVATHAALLASFLVFRRQLEQLEAGGCVAAGAASVVASRVASALPLRYDELLAFQYGFNAASRYVDLWPGMELVLDCGAFQYVAPPSQPGGNRNAYAGGGQARYRVHRRSDGTLGFDSFLDAIAGLQIATPTPPQSAGLLDLAAAGVPQNYFRLIYPPQLGNAVAVAGAPSAAANATLLGAAKLSDLDDATTQYLQSGSIAGPATCAFFSGRVAAVPQLTVLARGAQTPVPLCTTARELLARAFMLPFGEFNQHSSLQLQMWRWAQPSLADPNVLPVTDYNALPIGFEPTSSVSPSTGLTQWDLPLVMGDLFGWMMPGGST